ncbi:MAG: hypothetical protein ABJA87_02730 [bacterium]
MAGGSLAGRRAAGRPAGLPTDMIVAVSSEWVYGFAGRSRSREPGPMSFRVPREGLSVTVRQRVNVRLLELAVPGDGSRISLEGNRLPITHSNDMIKELVGRS